MMVVVVMWMVVINVGHHRLACLCLFIVHDLGGGDDAKILQRFLWHRLKELSWRSGEGDSLFLLFQGALVAGDHGHGHDHEVHDHDVHDVHDPSFWQ